MTLAEKLRVKHKAEKDFEREHGYTMPETLHAIDGNTVDAYTFNQGTISVEVGCDIEADLRTYPDGTVCEGNHSCPIVIRMWDIGGGGQGEAKVTFRDGEKTCFEMSTFGGWEHLEMVNAIKFVLDVIENGKPTNDYSCRFDDGQEVES